MSPLAQSLWVALGGALGANARYWIGVAIKARATDGFPWATVTVNLVGSFLIGLIAVSLVQKEAWAGWHLFIVVGVLGGFTTFSAFSMENLLLFQQGKLAEALLNSVGSCIFGVVLAGLGAAIATKMAA